MVVQGFSLEGKTAVVVGSGLGTETPGALAEAGADVALVRVAPAETERMAQAAAAVQAQGRRYLSLAWDVAEPEAVPGLVAEVQRSLSGIDILVLATEGVLGKACVDTTLDEWQRILNVNLTAPFLWARAVAPGMLAQGKGRIIALASVLAERGMSNSAAYCASKGGVLQLARALSQEWGQKGITVNAVAPGWLEGALNLSPDPEQQHGLVRYLPMRRLGQTGDLAALVVWLASDSTGFVTGQAFAVDGAATCHV